MIRFPFVMLNLSKHLRRLRRLRAHNDAERCEGISVANEFSVDADGKLVVPFGDHPVAVSINGRRERVIQRVDAETVDALNNDFTSLRRKVARAVFGEVPVYIGHPDVPDLADRYPDTRAYAWLRGINAHDGAMVLDPEWSPAGDELRKNKFYKWPSPRWDMAVVGVENGVKICRPCHLISVGLTNSPNIKTSPAINEERGREEPTKTQEVQVDKFKQFLVTLLGLANTATDDDITNAATSRFTALNELTAARERAGSELKTEREAWARTKLELEGKITAANELVKTERQAHLTTALITAVNDKKITAAQKDERLGKVDFANVEAFNAALTEISQLRVADGKLKTASTTGNLGSRQAEGAAATNRIQLIQDAINEEATKIPNYQPARDYDKAAAAARRAKPALFQPVTA